MGLFSRLSRRGSSQADSSHVNNPPRSIGEHYETLALEHLTRQGLALVERNFSTKWGEIDLIMRQGETWVFVEVRYRHKADFGHAAETVTRTKARKIIKTAQIWLARHNLPLHSTDIRFDVIALHQQGKQLEWYLNAITEN
ncbi:YraN family protein [Vibrio sp. WXL103]|uniref:YraN family protein n=1 Tax=unclassified Vibrio TaxID=2614977 RepID=UPI003EC94C2D